MADKRNMILEVEYRGKNRLKCPAGICKVILSPSTDPAVKQDIVVSLIKARKCEVANTHQSRQSGQTNFDPDDECGEKQGCSKATVSTDSSSGSPVFHVWKDKEDYLVELRHTRHDDFLATKNHQSFWYDIAQKLKEIRCDVTPTQCFNKYSSLKKKWKEIIDSPTGSESKYFRHKTSFDIIYGHKASTKPSCSIDTMGKNTDDTHVKEPSDTEENNPK